MLNIAAVTRLQTNKRALVLGAPATILALVTIISIIIALAMARAGLDPESAQYVQGFRQNTGVLNSISGFLVYLGVQAVATTFPFGMALGTTRRAYTLGTLGYNVLQSVYMAVLCVILLGLEKLTGHWFVHAYVMDTALLGNGNPFKLVGVIFVLTLTMMSIGGVFGSVFIKAGAKGPLFLAGVLAVLIAVGVLVGGPYLVSIFSGNIMAKLLGAGLVAVVLSNLGSYLALRTASVR